jgi:hypothetical protein
MLIASGLWLALSVIFGLAYTQSHLYNDNQNTKFLHGLTQAGRGLLEEDWLANTADPLPVFSSLVSLTNSLFGDNLFYVYYLLLMGIYIYSILGIASVLYAMDSSKTKYLAFFVLVLALHSIRANILSNKILGLDLTPLHFGVAGQYILGLDFQNSSFGVFLLLSIYAFLKRKHVWSIIWLSLASLFHPAYLFSAFFLTIAYLLIIFKENLDAESLSWGTFAKAAKEPFTLGGLALLLVSPVVWYNQAVSSSTSPELASRALDILVNQRIPHHALPEVWLDTTAFVQIGIIILALFLVRKSRLFLVMLVPFLGGLLFTGIQVLTNSNSLALIAPWRVSVFLVPLSTSLIIAYLLSAVFDKFKNGITRIQILLIAMCILVILFLVQGGIAVQRARNNKYYKQPTLSMMNHVKQNKSSGQVYLIPTRDNKFDEFRLYTGAPVYINWKSHPYQDLEVVEWYNRNQLAEEFYNSESPTACSVLQELSSNYQITHVVLDLEQSAPACDGLQETYRDERYAVYAIANQ